PHLSAVKLLKSKEITRRLFLGRYPDKRVNVAVSSEELNYDLILKHCQVFLRISLLRHFQKNLFV
ncbi:hypothetical protein, partial [Paenalcaligenes hominis]|uniref:hypothetical protein n=1 Tax=Paenalcaligenes hominis TaxID=643674 RepID=UPI001E64E3D3